MMRETDELPGFYRLRPLTFFEEALAVVRRRRAARHGAGFPHRPADK